MRVSKSNVQAESRKLVTLPEQKTETLMNYSKKVCQYDHQVYNNRNVWRKYHSWRSGFNKMGFKWISNLVGPVDINPVILEPLIRFIAARTREDTRYMTPG